MKVIVIAIATAFVVLLQPFDAAAEPQRPLLFVPGILGSSLSDRREIIWGDAGSLLDLEELDLLPTGRVPTPLSPTGIVQDVPLVFGLFKIDQYSSLLAS